MYPGAPPSWGLGRRDEGSPTPMQRGVSRVQPRRPEANPEINPITFPALRAKPSGPGVNAGGGGGGGWSDSHGAERTAAPGRLALPARPARLLAASRDRPDSEGESDVAARWRPRLMRPCPSRVLLSPSSASAPRAHSRSARTPRSLAAARCPPAPQQVQS